MIIWTISFIKPHLCLKPLRLTPKHGNVIVSKGFNNNDIGISIDANGQKCFNTDRWAMESNAPVMVNIYNMNDVKMMYAIVVDTRRIY